jgi:8-hydroxy-5-deazaflavin:NADPH oxidoreductase
MHITIFGTGSMGQALSSLAAKGGNSVQIIDSDDTAEVTGDIVILAVPYGSVASIAAERAAQLAGRIVVDITNPLDFETFDSLVVAADSSAAAELADALPNARVLKAFNTTFAGTLSAGVVGENPTTVLIACDDGDAKAQLAEVVSAGGLRAIDAGRLRRARELEAMGFLQLALAVSEKISWTGGFAVIP